MAVKITEDMYDTFTNNGYTQDDIQNTVSHYRDQGMPDSAIFTNLNKRYRDLANIKDVSTPQIGDQPNYDDILNNPALNPQQQAEQIKQKGEAYRSNLDQQLPADIAKNTLQGYVNNAGDFGKGLLQGVSSLGVGLGKNVINPLRTNLGKQPLTDEQLNNLYGVLAQKPTSLSGQVGKGIGEVLPYLTLPEATPFKGAGVASTLGNLGVTGAYQGALANTLSSLANKGISPDTLRDMATGAGTGALLNVGLGSALRYGLPKVAPKVFSNTVEDITPVVSNERPIGLSRLPKEIVPLAEAPTVGEAPIQQVSPKKFAIEADTNVETQPEINAVEQLQAPQPQVNVPEMVQPEIPTQDVNVSQISTTTKQTKLSESIQQAKGLPRYIKQAVKDNAQTYESMTNEALKNTVSKDLDANFDYHVAEILGKKKFDSAYDVERARQIVQRLGKQKTDAANELMLSVLEKAQPEGS